MYKFIKIKDIKTGISYKQWYLYCDNVTTLNDHWYNIIKCDVQNGVLHMISDPTLIGHSTSTFANTCQSIQQITGGSLLNIATNLEVRTYFDRINMINNNQILLLSNGLQYMTMHSDFKIIELIDRKNIDYISSQYNSSDIKITRWPNGKHFYANIGTHIVKDDDGNIKWNTYKAAENVALKYLNSLIYDK